MRDWAAIGVYTGLNIWLQVALLHFFSWWMLPITVLAFIATDFITAHVHWLVDTFGDVRTHPLKDIIYPFREHHTDQDIITTHDFAVANGNSALAVIPLMLAACAISSWHPLWAAFIGGIAGFSVLTNQIHKWAHQKHKGPIRWAQNLGIILTPELHEYHHSNLGVDFGITSNLCNAILRPGYWRWLESQVPWRIQRET